MLRAWRVNKYGDHQFQGDRGPGRERPKDATEKQAAKTTGKKASTWPRIPASRPPPASATRPKAPPRKKVPKPTE